MTPRNEMQVDSVKQNSSIVLAKLPLDSIFLIGYNKKQKGRCGQRFGPWCLANQFGQPSSAGVAAVAFYLDL